MTYDRKYRNQNTKISRRDERQHHQKYRCSNRYENDRNFRCSSTVKFIQSIIDFVRVSLNTHAEPQLDQKKNNDRKTLF